MLAVCDVLGVARAATVRALASVRGLAVEHATTPDEAAALVERLGKLYPKEQILVANVSPVIGTYAGPNAFAVTVLEKEKK